MLTYVVRRLLLMVPTLLGVTLVVFLTMALSPGGVGGAAMSAAGDLEAGQAQALRDYYNKRYGLDQPIPVQYLRWLNAVSPIGWVDGSGVGFKAPDLGESFTRGRPVLSIYAEALPITLLLNAVSLPIAWVVAVGSGVYAARFRGRAFDVASGATLLALYSIPVIWAGVMLIGYLASEQYLKLFPTGGLSSTGAERMLFLPSWDTGRFEAGWLLDRAWHLVLPVLCLTYGSFAVLSKLMRAAVLENINADFVRTARAKGVSETDVLWRHAVRNSLLPLITVSAGILPGLLGGSLIVEEIFSIRGMGKVMIEAVFQRDRDVVLAGTLIAGVLTLVCVLIADLMYAVADPRVSYD